MKNIKHTILILLAICMTNIAVAQQKQALLITPTTTTDAYEAWKQTFKQWQKLQKEGYVRENITVLFADGHDYYEIMPWVHMLYKPENPNITVTTAPATKANLEKVMKDKKQKDIYIWTYQFGTEIPVGKMLKLNDGEMEVGSRKSEDRSRKTEVRRP
ncbi:MAG: hypothetical protein PHU27_10420 [Salinivirgaceae bacterium]|nr:hypothetical protein [Salinivirgaceae bacterium]MDD4746724.1 hypothetical protein [Salinivirgaceae bacterium]